jgi:hypothetical protein
MRTRGWGLSFGTIAVVAAVFLLLPIPAAGDVYGHAISAGPEKASPFRETGTALAYRSPVAAESSSGSLGQTTIRSDPTTVARPAAGAAAVATMVSHPTSPQMLSEFPGVNQSAGGGYTWADAQVAMNGSYVFQVVNEYGRITSTDGATVYSQFTTQSFFGVNSSQNLGEVQVLYDLMSKRWLVSAEDFTANDDLFAVSTTSSPLGTYWTYYINVRFSITGGQQMISPTWGVSRTMFALGAESENPTSGAIYGSLLTVFAKTALEAGTLKYQVLAYYGYFSVVPARQISNNQSGPDVLYAATTQHPNKVKQLTELEFTGTVGSLTASAVVYAITGGGFVPLASQAGNTTLIEVGENEVQSVSWSFAGALWVTFEVACKPAGDATLRACVRVDAIATLTNTLLQDSNVAVVGTDIYSPTITAVTSGQGYLMMVAYSGPLTYPSIAVVGQNVSDSYGTFRGPVPVLSGTSYDSIGEYDTWSGIQFASVGSKLTAWGTSHSETPAGWSTEVVHFSFY